MKLSKEPKPYYLTVVSHFSMPYVEDPQAWMARQFKKFDKKVNEKVKDGYIPYGSLVIDHCDVASMDLVQAMVLNG
jgi:hypothetical protein